MEKIINRNNWISTLITLMTFIVISSCAREDSIPVTADFDIKVVNEDYSVPVRIEIKINQRERIPINGRSKEL